MELLLQREKKAKIAIITFRMINEVNKDDLFEPQHSDYKPGLEV